MKIRKPQVPVVVTQIRIKSKGRLMETGIKRGREWAAQHMAELMGMSRAEKKKLLDNGSVEFIFDGALTKIELGPTK